MTKTTKTLLVLAVVNLIAGLLFSTDLIDARNVSACYVALPAGAIFFGLFLIFWMLGKETARYDAEQREILAAADRLQRQSTPATPSTAHQPLPKPHSA